MNPPERVPEDWYVGFHRGLAARLWRAAGQAMVDKDLPIVRSAYHVFTTGELCRMLGAAGFRGVELLGEDGATPFRLGSRRLILVATA